MKEKIFKLYGSTDLASPDHQIARELLMAVYKEDLRRLGKLDTESYNGKKTISIDLEDFETFLGYKFSEEQKHRGDGTWSAIWFYKDELI